MKRIKKPLLEFYPAVEQGAPVAQLISEAEVHAGFPSPVDEAYRSQPIDLNEELIKSPATTYIVKVVGDSMIEEGIDQGDMLVVDRSLFPTERNIAVCMLGGEFCLKRIVQKDGKTYLYSGNQAYPPIEVPQDAELRVWGVVQWVLKRK